MLCDLLCDWLRIAEIESASEADLLIERLCETLKLSCRLADLLMLSDWLLLCDCDLL